MTGSKILEALFLLDAIDYLVPQVAQTRKPTADSVNLNRTKTSRETRKIEDRLASDLETIYKKILRDDTSKDLGMLQRKYGRKVEQLIRSAVQRIYLIGADYATRTMDTTAFITQRDLDNIRKQTKFSYDGFWRRISAALHRNEMAPIRFRSAAAAAVPEVLTPEYENPEDLDPYDSTSETSLIATLLATMILAQATFSKLDQIAPEFPEDQPKPKLVWITEQDNRVCNICAPLHGLEWELNDPDIPMPGPDDTHHRCRCRLLIKMGGDILSG